MSMVPVDPVMSGALWIVLKATLLLGAAALLLALLRRRGSAAARHFVLTLAVVGLLALPVLTLTLPEWAIAFRPGTTPVVDALHAAGGDVVEGPAPSAPIARIDAFAANAPAAEPITWSSLAASLYVAVAFAMLMYLALQRWRVRRIGRQASDVSEAEWARLLTQSASAMGIRRRVRLLRSRERSMPMTFGARRPAILLPAVADTWPEEQRRAVILHELAHVARHDCLTQALACVACALYWFHPAAWWVARRLRIERELACDDRVIATGTEAREYAGHLLEIAYAFGNYRAPALAVSMARPRQLEGRMLAVLDAARNRRVPALRARLTGLAVAMALLLPLAAVTTTTDAPGAAPGSTFEAPPSPAAATPPEGQEIGPVLKPTGVALRAAARRIVHAAAAAIGWQDGLPGTWEIRPSKNKDGTVHLRLVELNSSSGSNVPIDRLEGLTAAQLTGPGGPVTFRLRRDAGTFTFEGVIRNGVGAGTFSFAPDAGFPEGLAKRGFARPTAAEQYQLARHDVGYAFVDELSKQGYEKPATAELVRAGQHGVHTDYLREMGALGHRLGTLKPLIELRDHGVTPAYVRELADQGYKGLSADDLRRARDHGVTPDYVRAMREAGYGSLPMDQLINARDHGVSAEYVRELAEAGHRKVPLDQLVNVRDHGVSAEYVREMRTLGYELPLNDLVRARDHGVNVDFVRELAALGYGRQPVDAVIRLRDHGVTPGYVKELKSLGYDALSIEDLVKLRDHGLTADRIRDANARAGKRLPVDLLASMR
jgi:beta-lactamase regulating signal transducer with metallopeptidase domain